MKNYTYILKSVEYDQYYIGQTDNMDNRLERHNKGYEKYSSKYRPWRIALKIEKNNRSEAIILGVVPQNKITLIFSTLYKLL